MDRLINEKKLFYFLEVVYLFGFIIWKVLSDRGKKLKRFINEHQFIFTDRKGPGFLLIFEDVLFEVKS